LQLRGLRTLRTWLEDEKSEAQRTQKRGVSPARKSGAKHG